MKRKSKLIFMCLAFALLLAGYLTARNLTAQPEEGAGQVLVSISSDDLASISWTYTPQDEDEVGYGETMSVELTRSEGSWQYAPDPDCPISDILVDNKLSAISQVTAGTTISSPAELTEYGLDEPQLVIDAQTESGDVTMALGQANEMTGEYYMMLGQDTSTIYTVSSSIVSSFSGGLYDIIEKEEIPDFGQVTKLSISRSAGDLQMVYMEDSSQLYYNDTYHWFVDYGGQLMAADYTSASSLYAEITGLSWLQCVEYDAGGEDLAQYGLDIPDAVVSMTYEVPLEAEDDTEDTANPDTAVFTLLIGGDCDTGTYAMLEGSNMVYIISTDAADALRYTTYSTLKPDLICDMVWDSVESMSFTLNGETYTAQFSQREEDSINEEGQAETNTVDVYSWEGQELDQEEFESLMDGIDALQSSGAATGEASGEMLTIVFNRNTEYFSQMELTVSSYSADQCLVSFNGEERLTGRDSIVSLMDIIEGLFES